VDQKRSCEVNLSAGTMRRWGGGGGGEGVRADSVGGGQKQRETARGSILFFLVKMGGNFKSKNRKIGESLRHHDVENIAEAKESQLLRSHALFELDGKACKGRNPSRRIMIGTILHDKTGLDRARA